MMYALSFAAGVGACYFIFWLVIVGPVTKVSVENARNARINEENAQMNAGIARALADERKRLDHLAALLVVQKQHLNDRAKKLEALEVERS